MKAEMKAEDESRERVLFVEKRFVGRPHQEPEVLRSSLRTIVLQLLTATHARMRDPFEVLGEMLSAPRRDVVEEALGYLQGIGALRFGAGQTRRATATAQGVVLAQLPLCMDGARIALLAGQMVLLREGLGC